MEGHAKSAPISRLPLITIFDSKHQLKDIPVCQVAWLMIKLIVIALTNYHCISCYLKHLDSLAAISFGAQFLQ